MRVVLSLALLMAVSVVSRAEERNFTVRGTVTRPLTDGAVTISHEAIPNYMPAMTMPFEVAPEAEPSAATLRPGDKVEFQWRVNDDTSRASDFKNLGRDPTYEKFAPTPPSAQTRVKEGDPIAPFALTDQAGGALTEADLRGKATLLTFIFTRCPVPDFCPRMSARFQALQKRIQGNELRASTPVQLLSVTIDPDFDTPAVLRDYGQRYNANPAIWRFATGSRAQVDALRHAFAVYAEKSAAILDHTLATALIGPDLRVIAIWRGNRWTEDEVAARLPGISIPQTTGSK